MVEDDYYIRVSVDGKDVPLNDHCNGNPSSSDCKFTVSMLVFTLNWLKYDKSDQYINQTGGDSVHQSRRNLDQLFLDRRTPIKYRKKQYSFLLLVLNLK